MKKSNWLILLGSLLVLLSAIIYYLQVEIFAKTTDTFFYLFQDLAFVPIQVLFVTLIISGLLDRREKRIMLEKMNMVMGTFFSEVGTKLLVYFSDFDPDLPEIRKQLVVTKDWSEEEFFRVEKELKNYKYGVDINKVDLDVLKHFLMDKRDFLVRLLENPILLEHESFTEVLRAVFHFTEELTARESLKNLPPSDYDHLSADIKRAYTLLVHQWLDYMKYLKDNYPYLFSFAMRTNPFDQETSPIVK